MKKTRENLLGLASITALIIHTLLLGCFLFTAILLRLILLPHLGRKLAQPLVVGIASSWVNGILWWMTKIQGTRFDCDHNLDFAMDQWNLIIANHQSWVDIFALMQVTLGRLPILKFFIKKQLVWLPVVGAAWWALDYPFMSRYTKAYLQKHPEKAGKDLATTRRALKKFALQPTTIVNFIEGTRFTADKYAAQQPPYRHLLKPKAGGIAFAIQALGAKFNTIIDCTIHYQSGAPSTWDFACGRVGRVTIRLRKLALPERFLRMDYSNNAEDRAAFQHWVSELWQHKDQELKLLKN